MRRTKGITGIKGAAAAGVAVASVLALAACGPLGTSAGDKSKDEPTATGAPQSTDHKDSPLSGAAHAVNALDLVKKTTTGVHSAKVESDISIGSTMSITSKGAIDWRHGLVGTMGITYTGGSAAESLREAGAPTTMSARYLPDAYYVNLGSAMAAQFGGKHWVRYGYDDMGKLSDVAGSYMKDSIQNNNPVKSVDVALAAPDSRVVGTETVRGVRTTHYTATIDVQAMLGGTGTGLSAAEQSQLKDTLTKAGVSSETVDLWVSKDNLPVEAVVKADTKAGVMKTTTFYSDFGTAVTATPPAASDTVDFGDAMNKAQDN
ncbi:hypothetical protein OG900_16270 [Streptomyces sp. NBC_00433]